METHFPEKTPSVYESRTVEFLRELGEVPLLHHRTPVEARRTLEALQSPPGPTPGVRFENIWIPTRFGEISLRLIRPTGHEEDLPAIVYFHGGGWVLGSENTHQRLCGDLARGAGAVVVFVNYTSSPEARFPAALEQGYSGLKYLVENGKSLGIDSSRLAIAGDGAGGNLATVIARWVLERGGPALLFQVLFYPMTDAALETASCLDFAEGPWLTRATMEWFWEAYEPDPVRRLDADHSPLRTPFEKLRGLPPVLLITGENDMLRDEGEAYGRRLTGAGVDVTTVRFVGAIHDFAMLNALAETSAARDAIDLAVLKLREAFAPH